MSQLIELFSACTDAELDRLGKMALTGKEKSVYDISLRAKGTPVSPDYVMTKTGLSSSHYYKIISILTRKSIDHLADSSPESKVRFLYDKGLFVHLFHEMGLQGKLLEKKGDAEQCAAYYLFCFRMALDIPFRLYDAKAVAQMGKKYLECKADRSASDEDYVKFHTLFAECNRLAARKDPQKAFGKDEKFLLEKEKELLARKSPLALYYLYRTLCSYFTYYRKDHAKVLFYLGKAVELKDKIKDCFPVDVGQFLELLLADAHLGDGDVKKAFGIYKEVFDDDLSESMYGFYYHAEQYAITAILLEDHATAKNILEQHFSKAITSKKDIYATRGALTWAKLSLATGELKQAMRYISLANEINEKAFYLPFNVQIRVLETLCFFLREDYDFAGQLVNKNLKFIHSQKDRELLKDYIGIWKIIAAFINSIYNNESFPIKLEKDYERITKQYMNLYTDLIPLARRKTGEKLRKKDY